MKLKKTKKKLSRHMKEGRHPAESKSCPDLHHNTTPLEHELKGATDQDLLSQSLSRLALAQSQKWGM